MGVELRSFQRKFKSLMGEVKPQIKPRIVVWLDERLAEFKIKGAMQLHESLEDPKWIKDYNTSKRQARAAAIKERGTPSSAVQPKLEEKSESSNGIAHPEDLSEADKDEKHEDDTSQTKEETTTTEDDKEKRRLQLVEVKSEQIEDDDDDMIIVGESHPPPDKQSQYNPMRQLYPGFGGRSVGPFQRKRQRFGALPHRQFKTARFNKPNFRSSATTQSQPQFPSHTITSQSQYSTVPSESFTESYEQEYHDDSETYADESLRIPQHLQGQTESQEGVDYQVTEGDMYEEYGDDSYDSSFLTEGESSIVYDEEGNAILKGANVGDESSMDPVPGTSSTDPASSQDKIPGSSRQQSTIICPHCLRTFASRTSCQKHVRFYHLNQSRYICQYCSTSFPMKGNLEGHVNSVHLKVRPYVCYCAASFCYKGDLARHQKSSRCCGLFKV